MEIVPWAKKGFRDSQVISAVFGVQVLSVIIIDWPIAPKKEPPPRSMAGGLMRPNCFLRRRRTPFGRPQNQRRDSGYRLASVKIGENLNVM